MTICRHPLRIVTHAPQWLTCDACQADFPHQEDCPGLGTPGCADRCMGGAEPETAALDVGRVTVSLSHVYCCDRNVALCSTNLTGVEAVWDDLPLCVVCEALLAAGEPCKADCQFAPH